MCIYHTNRYVFAKVFARPWQETICQKTFKNKLECFLNWILHVTQSGKLKGIISLCTYLSLLFFSVKKLSAPLFNFNTLLKLQFEKSSNVYMAQSEKETDFSLELSRCKVVFKKVFFFFCKIYVIEI